MLRIVIVAKFRVGLVDKLGYFTSQYAVMAISWSSIRAETPVGGSVPSILLYLPLHFALGFKWVFHCQFSIIEHHEGLQGFKVHPKTFA